MKILAVGGGSGGHVTPVIAVINELAKQDTELSVMFLTDHKFGPQAELLMQKAVVDVKTKRIFAGKLRRYHGVSILRQLLDVQTTLLNIRDIYYIFVGIGQTLIHAVLYKPDVIFTKGGFVCLPAGIVAKLLRIPMVTHDSDMRPGLTNKIISRWATTIATGMPLDNYPYDPVKSHYVGVPIDDTFRPFDRDDMTEARHTLGFVDIERPLIVVTGGGLGARRINDAMIAVVDELCDVANVYHITGVADFERISSQAPDRLEYIPVPFIHKNMDTVLGAADVVVTRASATTLLELAGLAKAVIAIPSKVLGDQQQNGRAYAEAEAVELVHDADIEKDPTVLLKTLQDLLKNKTKRDKLAQQLHTFARPNAAIDTAALIMSAAKPPAARS